MQLKFYEPWYVLPAYYSASKTYDDKLTRFEIKAQVSFRVDILDNVMCEYCAFGFGFTNVIYLQTYNPDESSPLRDIDLSPSISFDYKKTRPIKDGEWGYINWLSFGYLHTSNGEREDINPRDPRQSAWGGNFVRSKSLDRIFVEVGYSYMDLNIRFRAWIKQALAAFDGDRTNGDIADYIGMIRRFMPVFVGYSGIIISTYQLLELAIFGADMFVIDMSHIKCYVEILGVDNKTEMIDSISNKLIAFGINIGLVPILYLNDDSRHIFLQNSDVLESVLIYNENYDIDNKIIFGNTHKANVALERIIT